MSLNETAKRGLEDLYFFCIYHCGLDLVEQPHREMCDVFQATEDNPEETPYGMLIVPRGTYKTSIGRATAVWKQLRQIHLFDNVYHRIAIASATLSLSKSTLNVIAGLLRHGGKEGRIIRDYGTLWLADVKRRRFSGQQDGIVLAPRMEAGEIPTVAEPSFWIGSERRVSTGYHADGALIDDLNNHSNVRTAEQREKMKQYWRLFFPILNRKDRVGRPTTIMMNATPWHDDDVRGMVLRQERDRQTEDPEYKSPYLILHKSAINDDGTAFAPTILPTEALQKLREEMSPAEFSANYLCDPIGENGFVSEDEIIFKPRMLFPPDLRYFRATVDTNSHFAARDLGCYAAIMVSGYDRFANLYFYDARGSREWSSSDLIDALFQLNEDYKDIPILIEDVHMAHFDHALRLEEANRNVRLRVQYVPTEGESKYNKWDKLRPRFRTHRIFFAEEIPMKLKAEIKEELVRGPVSRFKDFLDAMAMAEIGIRPRVDKKGNLEERIADLSKRLNGAMPQMTFADLIKGMK